MAKAKKKKVKHSPIVKKSKVVTQTIGDFLKRRITTLNKVLKDDLGELDNVIVDNQTQTKDDAIIVKYYDKHKKLRFIESINKNLKKHYVSWRESYNYRAWFKTKAIFNRRNKPVESLYYNHQNTLIKHVITKGKTQTTYHYQNNSQLKNKLIHKSDKLNYAETYDTKGRLSHSTYFNDEEEIIKQEVFFKSGQLKTRSTYTDQKQVVITYNKAGKQTSKKTVTTPYKLDYLEADEDKAEQTEQPAENLNPLPEVKIQQSQLVTDDELYQQFKVVALKRIPYLTHKIQTKYKQYDNKITDYKLEISQSDDSQIRINFYDQDGLISFKHTYHNNYLTIAEVYIKYGNYKSPILRVKDSYNPNNSLKSKHYYNKQGQLEYINQYSKRGMIENRTLFSNNLPETIEIYGRSGRLKYRHHYDKSEASKDNPQAHTVEIFNSKGQLKAEINLAKNGRKTIKKFGRDGQLTSSQTVDK